MRAWRHANLAPATHLGAGVYGFSLRIDRMGVPLMARMSEAAKEQKLNIGTPEQQPFF